MGRGKKKFVWITINYTKSHILITLIIDVGLLAQHLLLYQQVCIETCYGYFSFPENDQLSRGALLFAVRFKAIPLGLQRG